MKPHRLFDFLKKEYKLNTDARLSEVLDVPPPVISRIRSGRGGGKNRYEVSARMIINIYKKTGMSIEDIESFLGENENAKSD